MLGQYREAGAKLERADPNEALACEPGKPAALPHAPLFRITADARLRLWATGGPYPDLSGLFPPVLLRVYRGCPGEPGSTVVACGDPVAVDLPAGKYFIAAVHTSTVGALAANPPTGAFAYRLSPSGDTQCPTGDLARRRLDDWMGEAPPEQVELGRLNPDALDDLAVRYRAASNAPATRVLVAAPYPECVRTVLDGAVTVKVEGGESGGWKHLRTTSVSATPGDEAGTMLVARRSSFDAKVGRYVEGKALGCSLPGPDDTPRPVPCPAPDEPQAR